MHFIELSQTAQQAAIEMLTSDIEFCLDLEYNQAILNDIISEAMKYDYEANGSIS